jgi:D-alanyl-D-alanine carboxypeptidase
MYGALKFSSPARRLTNMVAAAGAAIVVMGAVVPAFAADPTAASMVVDANTGTVLHNRAGDEKVYPASLTKMMTLYMAFELIELGRLDYDSKIKMTQEGADAAPSKLDLEPGEELTVLNAIKALVTKSANDVAIALAMHIGGTETNFARLMTRKAREIGMANTTFRNASGLPDPEQTTTARDMITLGLRLQDDFPRQYRLFSTRTFTYGGKNYRNHNTLLGRYEGTDGIKTGYTRASGFNLVSSVRRNGKHVVAAVFGGDTARSRNAKMQSILNAALAKASTNVTRKPALVARAPQPARAARPPVEVAEASRAAEPPPPASVALAPATRQREASIAVAKVRAVRIGEDTRTPRVERVELNPSPAQPVFAVADAGGSAPPARDAGTPFQAFPRFVPETGALQPSTLQAQAAQLEGDYAPAPAPRPVAALTREAPRTPAARTPGARGPFEIQIGAFGDSAEAERRMAAARQRAGGILDAYRADAIPVQNGKLYRARFRGFDATAANATCSRLKSMQIDCFVTKTE